MNNSLFATCTGLKIKIAIVDSGVLPDINNINCVTQKFNTDFQSKTKNNHAALCLNMCRILAPKADYVLVNIGNIGIVTEENVLIGLEQILKIAPSIVIMSISFESVSEKFKKLISKISKRGTIICASHDPCLGKSFPECLEEVISVDESISSPDQEGIKFDGNTFYVDASLYSEYGEKGSSAAAAFFSGYIACLFEFNPLITNESIKKFFRKNTQKPKINQNNAYYLDRGRHEIDKYLSYTSKNYLYYYDEKSECFREKIEHKKVENSLIAGVDVIYGDDFAVKNSIKLNNFKEKNIKFRIFDNFGKDQDYFFVDYLKTISTPSICIGSYGMNMEKFKIQTYLNKYFKSSGYTKIGNVSFNPMAQIFGYKFIRYPKNNIHYPDYFYFLNNCLWGESSKKEILISSMAGEIDRFVDFKHRIGKISSIFFKIHNPDIIIVSLSDFIEIAELIRLKFYIQKIVGSKLLFYISSRSKDDNFYGVSDYDLVLNEEQIMDYQKHVEIFTKTKTFSQRDLENDKLFKNILKLF
ncbi:MAG: S8/S53 family peptidase [Oscillospiraceae bacterium]|jgi:hypothetical protein|nr:S8/S53 family peptidase [Oscillospiraceae bacterium]